MISLREQTPEGKTKTPAHLDVPVPGVGVTVSRNCTRYAPLGSSLSTLKCAIISTPPPPLYPSPPSLLVAYRAICTKIPAKDSQCPISMQRHTRVFHSHSTVSTKNNPPSPPPPSHLVNFYFGLMKVLRLNENRKYIESHPKPRPRLTILSRKLLVENALAISIHSRIRCATIHTCNVYIA